MEALDLLGELAGVMEAGAARVEQHGEDIDAVLYFWAEKARAVLAKVKEMQS